MRLAPGTPVEQRGDARIHALGSGRGNASLRTVRIAKMHEEVLGLQRAPVEVRIRPMELGPLRAQRRAPEQQ